MGCKEAYACGKASLIADSPLSAAAESAYEGSLFTCSDAGALARRIDHLIEHPSALSKLTPRTDAETPDSAGEAFADSFEEMICSVR